MVENEKAIVEKSTTELINEIFNRPALWDRTSSHYHNRLTTDSQWEEISHITGIPKDRAKVKWKRLRDIYRKELKKMLALEERDGRTPDQPRWLHFTSMEFLRNALTTDLLKNGSLAEPAVKKEPSVSDSDDEAKYQRDDQGPYSEHIRHHRENSLWNHQTLMEPTVEIQTAGGGGGNNQAGGNRHEYQNQRQQQETAMNSRKRLMPDEDDDDMHFLKSLAPYLKMLPLLKKLKVRNDIQLAILAGIKDEDQAS